VSFNDVIYTQMDKFVIYRKWWYPSVSFRCWCWSIMDVRELPWPHQWQFNVILCSSWAYLALFGTL